MRVGDTAYAVEPLTEKIIKGKITAAKDFTRDCEEYFSLQGEDGKTYRLPGNCLYHKRPKKVKARDSYGEFTKWEG